MNGPVFVGAKPASPTELCSRCRSSLWSVKGKRAKERRQQCFVDHRSRRPPFGSTAQVLPTKKSTAQLGSEITYEVLEATGRHAPAVLRRQLSEPLAAQHSSSAIGNWHATSARRVWNLPPSWLMIPDREPLIERVWHCTQCTDCCFSLSLLPAHPLPLLGSLEVQVCVKFDTG